MKLGSAIVIIVCIAGQLKIVKMFVSDSTLLMGIKLQILNAEGHSMVTQIDPNSTVESLKQSALAFFYPHEGTSASVPKGEQFRSKFLQVKGKLFEIKSHSCNELWLQSFIHQKLER